jgi:hypothetical protein
MDIVDPKSERGQQIIRNSAFEKPLTQGDPPPIPAEILEALEFGAERAALSLTDIAMAWSTRLPKEPVGAPSAPPKPAACHDCGRDYETFDLDMVLPTDEWREICPEGGVLCPSCIVKRAARIADVIVVEARFRRRREYDDQSSAPSAPHPPDEVDPFVAIDALIEEYRSDNRAFGEWVGHIPLSKLKPLIEQARGSRDMYFGLWKDERALHLHALGELKHALAAERAALPSGPSGVIWEPNPCPNCGTHIYRATETRCSKCGSAPLPPPPAPSTETP